MSTASVENVSSIMKTKPTGHSFMKYRALLIFFSQTCLVVVTYYASFLLRLDANLDAVSRSVFWKTLPLVLIVKLTLSYRFGLLRGWWRYVGMSDLLDISKASFVSSSILFCVIEGIIRPSGFPRSVIPIDLVLTIMVVGGARFAVRAYTERARNYGTQRDTLIIGAGMAGSSIMRELKQNTNSTYNPIGFIDDDPSKMGIKINGIKVLGNTDQLNELIARHNVECILIAIPSAQGPEIARIIRKVRECRVEFKILPAITELIDKPASVNQVRKLRLEDLLNRRPVQLDFEKINEKLAGKTLLVTGAGGSIGSELVRQLARVSPRQLILLERSENDLFKLAHGAQQHLSKIELCSSGGRHSGRGLIAGCVLHLPATVGVSCRRL